MVGRSSPNLRLVGRQGVSIPSGFGQQTLFAAPARFARCNTRSHRLEGLLRACPTHGYPGHAGETPGIRNKRGVGVSRIGAEDCASAADQAPTAGERHRGARATGLCVSACVSSGLRTTGVVAVPGGRSGSFSSGPSCFDVPGERPRLSSGKRGRSCFRGDHRNQECPMNTASTVAARRKSGPGHGFRGRGAR